MHCSEKISLSDFFYLHVLDGVDGQEKCEETVSERMFCCFEGYVQST